MESVQYKEYQLSDLTNLIIEYDRKIENKFRVEIVLLIMEQRKQYCLNIRLPEFDAPADLPISYGNVRKEGDIVYLNDVLSGIQIILKEKESNFSCCTGFYFLMGKEFVYQSINFIDEEYLSFDIDEGKCRRVKREHLYEDEMSNEVVPFQLGMYGHQFPTVYEPCIPSCTVTRALTASTAGVWFSPLAVTDSSAAWIALPVAAAGVMS